MTFSETGAGPCARQGPLERAEAGWLRFGITALPEHGPPLRRR